jgi:hypothetical protein
MRACLGRGPSDSNSSIPYFDFSVFSTIWGTCFLLKANPNGMKISDSGTVLATRNALNLVSVTVLAREAVPEPGVWNV